MRKLLALAMVVLVGMTALAVVGCGSGDTKTAQQYLKQADASFAALQKSLTQLKDSMTATLVGALTGNYSSVTPEALNTANGIINTALQQLPGITAEYGKVNGLKGVDDYKAYAAAMIKAVEVNQGSLKQGQQLFQQLLPITGNQAAMAAWFQANSNTLTEAQNMDTTATKAYDDAQKIKKEKNLSW